MEVNRLRFHAKHRRLLLGGVFHALCLGDGETAGIEPPFVVKAKVEFRQGVIANPLSFFETSSLFLSLSFAPIFLVSPQSSVSVGKLLANERTHYDKPRGEGK